MVNEFAHRTSGLHHAFLANQGKCDDAKPLYKRALAIREETLGPLHPQVTGSLNSLADLLVSQVTTWHCARLIDSPFDISVYMGSE